MMKKPAHYLLIDPLEKLTIKKDSSLLLAHSLKEAGHEVHLVFAKDFFLTNQGAPYLHVYDFVSEFLDQGPYLKRFVLGGERITKLMPGDIVHMRLDPPVDSRYMRICWMLDQLSHFGVVVVNNPRGILQFNEKIYAYFKEGAIPTYIGESVADFLSFCEHQKDAGATSLIVKPLDLFQGIGVEKYDLNQKNLAERFIQKCIDLKGPVVAQPYQASVELGEVRALYFKGVELGSILKIPPRGEFLANIAQGASFERVELNEIQKARCELVTKELMEYGVDWVAFDILGDSLSEVNLTCPGLLVEVSKACEKNLALEIIKRL
jgi:glutathione synthase